MKCFYNWKTFCELVKSRLGILRVHIGCTNTLLHDKNNNATSQLCLSETLK